MERELGVERGEVEWGLGRRLPVFGGVALLEALLVPQGVIVEFRHFLSDIALAFAVPY